MLHAEHECEIETEHEDFLPDRNFFQKAFDMFRFSLMASEKNPGARKYLRSRASIISEKRRHLHTYKHILHPFSIFRYISLTSFYNLLVYMKCIGMCIRYQIKYIKLIRSFLAQILLGYSNDFNDNMLTADCAISSCLRNKQAFTLLDSLQKSPSFSLLHGHSY